MNRAIYILWPSFVVGGAGEVLFFTVFDPKELYLFGEPTGLSRLAVYSIGFFFMLGVRGGVERVHVLPAAQRRRGEPLPPASGGTAPGLSQARGSRGLLRTGGRPALTCTA